MFRGHSPWCPLFSGVRSHFSHTQDLCSHSMKMRDFLRCCYKPQSCLTQKTELNSIIFSQNLFFNQNNFVILWKYALCQLWFTAIHTNDMKSPIQSIPTKHRESLLYYYFFYQIGWVKLHWTCFSNLQTEKKKKFPQRKLNKTAPRTKTHDIYLVNKYCINALCRRGKHTDLDWVRLRIQTLAVVLSDHVTHRQALNLQKPQGRDQ